MMSKSSRISVSSEDDFLYHHLMRLLEQIKITQGGTELAYTLRNHRDLKNYCIAKQAAEIQYIEDKYFYEDGSLNIDAINSFHIKNRSLQRD